MTLIAAQAPIARPPNGEAANHEAAVNRPDVAPDKTAVTGPPVLGAGPSRGTTSAIRRMSPRPRRRTLRASTTTSSSWFVMRSSGQIVGS